MLIATGLTTLVPILSGYTEDFHIVEPGENRHVG